MQAKRSRRGQKGGIITMPFILGKLLFRPRNIPFSFNFLFWVLIIFVIKNFVFNLIVIIFGVVNEICDKLAVVGFGTNMLNYLTKQLHLPLTRAANTLTNFNGTASLTPLLGAFIADAYAGRFWTITFASTIYLLVKNLSFSH